MPISQLQPQKLTAGSLKQHTQTPRFAAQLPTHKPILSMTASGTLENILEDTRTNISHMQWLGIQTFPGMKRNMDAKGNTGF